VNKYPSQQAINGALECGRGPWLQISERRSATAGKGSKRFAGAHVTMQESESRDTLLVLDPLSTGPVVHFHDHESPYCRGHPSRRSASKDPAELVLLPGAGRDGTLPGAGRARAGRSMQGSSGCGAPHKPLIARRPPPPAPRGTDGPVVACPGPSPTQRGTGRTGWDSVTRAAENRARFVSGDAQAAARRPCRPLPQSQTPAARAR
jgi:hypothetical protein